jgi:hypothetical protein
MRAAPLVAALMVAASPVRAAAEEPARPAAPVDPTLAAPAAPPRPDLRARPREVVGLAGLGELGPDPEVAERTEGLRARRTGGIVSFAGAAAAFITGGVLYFAETAATASSNLTTSQICGSRPGCQKDPDYTAAYVSYGIAAGLALIGLAVWPREHEYAETVDLWNARHPAQPAEWVGWAPRPGREEAAPEAAPPQQAAPPVQAAPDAAPPARPVPASF